MFLEAKEDKHGALQWKHNYNYETTVHNLKAVQHFSKVLF